MNNIEKKLIELTQRKGIGDSLIPDIMAIIKAEQAVPPTTPDEPSKQDKVIAFMNDPNTLKKAAEGSMEKRQALLDRVAPDELEAILHEVYKRGHKCAAAGYVSKDDENHAVKEAIALITQGGKI